VLAVAADLSTAEGAEKVVNATLEAFGGIDILINNVGTAKGTDIVNTADGEWQDALDHTLYPAHPHVAPCRAAHAGAAERIDRHDCVDLGDASRAAGWSKTR
jgi:NAD(P)-dependent dehydrogenase (short-subunit alcohol dehydrogenase family)